MVEVTRRWQKGDLVQKRQKSKWRGRIVGFYDTAETPEGYSVESLFENGSVQVWPLAALDDWDGTGTPEQLQAELAAAKAREAKLLEALEDILTAVDEDDAIVVSYEVDAALAKGTALLAALSGQQP